MGGDGTANEVLNGAGDALPIGVLPAGGTSVLPRALGMPRDIGRAARRHRGRARRGARADDQPRPRQRPPLRVRLRARRRRRRPCGSWTTRAGRRAVAPATPTSRRRSCARCCAETSASRSSRCGSETRSLRAGAASSSPTCTPGATSGRSRSSSPRARPSRAASTSWCRATCAAATCRATRRSSSSRAARPIAPIACSPTCTTSTRCASRAAAAAAARRRRRPRRRRGGALRRRAQRRADPRVTPPLLFDLDGTLVDSRVVDRAALARVLRAQRARLRRRARGPARRPQRRHDPRRGAAPRCPGGGRAGSTRARRPTPTGSCLVAGADRVLARLEDGRFGIVTSGHRVLAERRLRAVGLPVPPVMVCGDEIMRGKPDPEGFLTGARLLGVEPPSVRRLRGRARGHPRRARGRHAGRRHHDDARAATRSRAQTVVIPDLMEFDAALAAGAPFAYPAAPARRPGRLRPAWTLPSRSGRGWASASPVGSRRSRCSCRCSGQASTRRALGGLGAPGLVVAAVDFWLPQPVRVLLRVAAGAAAGEFWIRDDLEWAGLAIGGAGAAVMAIAAVPLSEAAARAGSRAATALIAAVASLDRGRRGARAVRRLSRSQSSRSTSRSARAAVAASGTRACGSCADGASSPRRRPASARVCWRTRRSGSSSSSASSARRDS